MTDQIEMTECPVCHGLFKEVFGETFCRNCAYDIAKKEPSLKMFPTLANARPAWLPKTLPLNTPALCPKP